MQFYSIQSFRIVHGHEIKLLIYSRPGTITLISHKHTHDSYRILLYCIAYATQFHSDCLVMCSVCTKYGYLLSVMSLRV